ncbi:LuxR C-terminal-related transcriptional regulator [Solwaraspora sp. WMMA2056]|uniref:LuxR C-terminal-related transcriptional regulator n=1 Tax=Solwaraspora sp. WMMA2056 TaxID=3015161 RepID=UPI00259BA074|nr:LuxR family transcriptional regulator [Solwaraspora sp. WMMA2056]WJK42800.1 LuxR C-terminal-related transcriptional regulator [Solwaraspora sp. WMMA2056]
MSHKEVDQPPMVGRQAELRAVRAALTGPPAGRHGALIAGSAGVGKSRLSQEVTAGLAVAGWRLLRAHASGSGTGLPLAALAGLIPPPASATPLPPPTPVRHALAGLRAAAARARSVLVIDDAHLLDEASAAVVHQLVADGTVPVLVTVRADKPVPEAVTALWKDAGVHRIDLAPLSPPQTEALVVAVLGGPVKGRTLRRLRDAAAGNPLLLRELIASAREAGLLDRPAGLWRLAGPLDATPRLTELLGSRLTGADPAERDALELLALSQHLPLPAAVAVAGSVTLETLERRGLVAVITTDGQQVVQLSHPLYAELLRAGTPELARLRHSRQLADAIEAAGELRGVDVMRVALWRLDGGGTVDVGLMLAAAREAAYLREYELAARLAQRAYQAGGEVAAGLAAVRALFQLGRLDEAVRRCAALSSSATSGAGHGDAERTQIAIQLAVILVHGADDVAAAHAALDAVAAADPGCREQIDAVRLYLRAYQLDCSVVAPALTLFHTDGPVELRLAAAGAASCGLLLAGRFTEAEQLLADVVPVARRHIGPGQVQSDGFPAAIASLLVDLPDVAGAQAAAESTYQTSLQPPDRVGQALAAFFLAKIALLRGRPTTALRWANEAYLVADDVQLRGVRRWAAGLRLQAAAQLGDRAAAGQAAADLDRHPGGPHGVRLFDIELARGRAWLTTLTGDTDRALRLLEQEVVRHGTTGAVGAGTLGALDLIRLGGAAVAVRLLADHQPPHGWVLGRTVVDYATAAATRDAEVLLRVARTFAGYDMPLHAAEAATLAAAAGAAGGGDGRVTAVARLFADRELARCERPTSPALRQGGPTAGLTSREREVVLAAAGGESAREIAARLHLSTRTVENHLHRAYGKLGIAGRAELHAVLTPR